jgi:MFS family permease
VGRRYPNRLAFVGVFSATLLGFLAVGAVLPVLPRYVTGPLGAGDVAVGVVTGAFALTAVVGRPIGGRIADRRGRKLIVVAGLIIASVAGALLFLPLGLGGLIVARLVLGVGDGWVFTAGVSWAVDVAPEERRGQAIAYYGLGVWGGLSLGPIIGEGLYAAGGFDLVWAFAAASPLAGALVARAVPERHVPAPVGERQPLLPRAALRPGVALLMANLGYAALAGFIVLHLEELGAGHGAAVFTVFATMVVVTRVAFAWVPDRIGARRSAALAGAAQALGLALIALAGGIELALAGALAMGVGFSLSFPSLALLVVERVDERRRGAAMGAFTAFFDVGVGLGAPLAGAVSALAGYPAAFGVAAACAAAGALLALSARSS